MLLGRTWPTTIEQTLRPRTSAESDADFISKCCISLKECRESWTRLRICQQCRFGSPNEVTELVQEIDELIAIITTIIRNKRSKMKMRIKSVVRALLVFLILNS